ncbi:NtaA/DmoA family FMN-dependent monooxygenase [Yinghuangia seranimata]|uniref:NtaA/DmoA family FMN-dependent monooxygenase n=1 Tax=Yinghuangia seranimata TaxID=408067 RepID=UPI00248AF5B1|nr:NtaA/DmoA family FMN-dependent monooxygenase [Yinghuangia seranimata]MDI2132027.1 NtaA/DmoA family FMN-dependent monooxygenase [Yinghuangia seranimata]
MSPRRQIHLAAHFPGVNHHTVWSDPTAGSQIDFASFAHLARTAERGLFDYFFLAEGQRVREHRGRIFDLDVVGRPDALTVLAALAAVTDRIGLAATATATYNEPYELARKLASLDHVSGGRAAWNAVTSPDAWTGENFRRGGFLPRGQRYERATEFVDTVRAVWDSWAPDAVVADREAGVFAPDGDTGIGRFTRAGKHFAIEGAATVPRAPQGHPVLIQAGDSDEGREFGAAYADVIFTPHGALAERQAFFADVKGRLAKYGRHRDELKVMPGAGFVLGATDEEARERAEEVRRHQISPQNALHFLEQVWGRDLSDLDPDGPLPDFDPDVEAQADISQGRVRLFRDPLAVARQWRERAAAQGLSIRELVIEVFARPGFVGSPSTVAALIDEYVQSEACDGFILVPTVIPHGLDEFVETVVPLLQERGSFRTAYTGSTLRDHLGLGAPRASTHSEGAEPGHLAV